MTKVIRTIPQRDEKVVHPVHTSGERLGASRTPAPSRLVSVVPRDGMFCNPHPTINRWATIPPGLGSCASVRLDTYSNGMDHPGQRNENGFRGISELHVRGLGDFLHRGSEGVDGSINLWPGDDERRLEANDVAIDTAYTD